MLAIDQGTSGTCVLVADGRGSILGKGYAEIRSHSPHPAWVEQSASEILWQTGVAVREAVEEAQLGWHEIAAVGIANQRETTILWERETGRPVGPAISWQCRRTAELCRRSELQAASPLILEKTGLTLDPYYSASKISWLFEQSPGLRERAARGEVLFGTVDSWLAWNLTGGDRHITDTSNASRTMLFNLHRLDWDEDLLDLFGIPRRMLPEVVDSSGPLAKIDLGRLPGQTGAFRRAPSLPLCAVAGDQQAALFGQCCFSQGDAKATYGTGAFVLMNAGREPRRPDCGLANTVAWTIQGRTEYALEGSVLSAGAVIKWLRDSLGILENASQSDDMARGVEDSGGVWFVPALSGLGAPHWQPETRGTLLGLTSQTSSAHVVRAALEGVAHQVADVVEAMERAGETAGADLKADGGMVANGFLMQFQADTLGRAVVCPVMPESTALGAAYLAGLASGVWRGRDEIARLRPLAVRYDPQIDETARRQLRRRWQGAVALANRWPPAT